MREPLGLQILQPYDRIGLRRGYRRLERLLQEPARRILAEAIVCRARPEGSAVSLGLRLGWVRKPYSSAETPKHATSLTVDV